MPEPDYKWPIGEGELISIGEFKSRKDYEGGGHPVRGGKMAHLWLLPSSTLPEGCEAIVWSKHEAYVESGDGEVGVFIDIVKIRETAKKLAEKADEFDQSIPFDGYGSWWLDLCKLNIALQKAMDFHILHEEEENGDPVIPKERIHEAYYAPDYAGNYTCLCCGKEQDA